VWNKAKQKESKLKQRPVPVRAKSELNIITARGKRDAKGKEPERAVEAEDPAEGHALQRSLSKTNSF
jgi:hypothetical protein